MQGDGNHNEFLNFHVNRAMINLAKDCLCILEDFKEDGIINDDYYQKLRSRLLSRSNDSIRELKEIISQFDIELKKTKL